MRKSIGVCLAVILALIVLSTFLIQRGTANERYTGNDGTNCRDTAEPPQGERCTRLPWQLIEDRKKEGKPLRCLRSSPRDGELLVNTAPKIELKASPADIVLPCASGKTACTLAASQTTKLQAVGSDAEKDPLLYTFSTTGGRIAGDGAEAAWDLSAVGPGTYTAIVQVDDGCGCVAFADTNVTVTACTDCK